ncbi:hypothetical protein C8R44DRAFT_876510 [Mycena epipterygia]|nr:hypothetical protein C8R44DRAFT_876510 [Mycena epipterygia]
MSTAILQDDDVLFGRRPASRAQGCDVPAKKASSSIELPSFHEADAFNSVFVSILCVLSAASHASRETHSSSNFQGILTVGVVWTLNFVYLVLIYQAVYYYLVTNWGNEAALTATATELDLHLVRLPLATIICQGFFLQWYDMELQHPQQDPNGRPGPKTK